ncbi:hypothetical protein [Shewanella woodyi]|uniref:hypothetical protein n=1 Tax=Shewanella woodyi TaxID=60961 RepID=UPI0012FB34A9|nr:hypothetical protein [Shewanella woodyi]
MDLGLLELFEQIGSPVAAVLLWRINMHMVGQKAAMIKLIHEIDKRLTQIDIKTR